MSRNISIKSGYLTKNRDSSSHADIPKYYAPSIQEETTTTHTKDSKISSTLPTDLDVFSELPDSIFLNKRVLAFVNAFKESLHKFSAENITLSKLRISEQTDTTIVLDWIYNYFRVYFSFDNDGDYYGFIINNTEEGEFTNRFMVMKPEQYEDVTQNVIGFVTKMIRS